MGLNKYNLRKWYLMLTGKSVLHVNQNIGKCFSVAEIKGYYNNLTEKVLKQPELLENNALPTVKDESGRTIEFPVAIFQYGLGAYDLFLQKGEKKYKDKFMQCCEWALLHQQENGAWSNFFFIYPQNPYGAMCQGEGASLLLRGFVSTGNKVYFDAAKRAIDFMLLSIQEGGCTDYIEKSIVMLEYTHRPAVLNGWIFALFGLYDYVLIPTTEAKYKDIFKESVESLLVYMPKFTTAYWSKYDLCGRISSPFYHNLQIAQMEALYQMTGRTEFDAYAKKWKRNQKNIFCKLIAFIKKIFQKVFE